MCKINTGLYLISVLIKCSPLMVALVVKNPPANVEDARDIGSIPGLGRSPGVGNGSPLQYSCLENSHGQRNLVGYSPQGCKESDTTAHTQWFVECMNDCTQIKAVSLWGSREGRGVGCSSWGSKESNTTVLTHKTNLHLWIPILLKDEELYCHIICPWNVLWWIIYWVGQKVWVFP